MTLFSGLFRPAIAFILLWTVIFGVAYPLLGTSIVQGLFPYQAQGSLITGKDGKLLGSELIGQQFSKPEYFWGRLSATGPTAYNAAASTGSNLSPANPALLAAVQTRIDALRAADPDNTTPIPVDLVTASGSGLDPNISPAAAEYQIGRVAKARGLSEMQIRKLVEQYTAPRQLGVLGEPGVNVLELNLALDGKL